jgi:hypothetical protein
MTMSMKKKLFAAAAAVALVGAITAGPASAAQSQNSTPGFTVNAGTGPHFDTQLGGLAAPQVGAFNDVTMNGTPQLTAASIAPFTVVDASGTGAGWHVTLLVPDFSDVGGHVVPAALAEMKAPVVSAANTDSVLGGISESDNVDFTTAKPIIVADPGAVGAPAGPGGVGTVSGMGTYLVSPNILKLVVPANAVAGTYSTTATIAIVDGP